jgi:hypothetical protein
VLLHGRTLAHLLIHELLSEISRLELSLLHLKATQQELDQHLQDTALSDPDLKSAFEENKIVMLVAY